MNFNMLCEWYSSKCNGDWEHTYGLTIDNVDNPGWSITLRDEPIGTLYGKPEEYFPLPVDIERTEDDFITFVSKYGKSEIYVFCGPKNLEEAIDRLWDFYLSIPVEG